MTEDEIFELYGKLNEIENSLKECKVSFLRVHQSYLVNYKHVKGQSYDFVVMDNEKKISISEDRRKMISEQYCSMEDTFYGVNSILGYGADILLSFYAVYLFFAILTFFSKEKKIKDYRNWFGGICFMADGNIYNYQLSRVC